MMNRIAMLCLALLLLLCDGWQSAMAQSRDQAKPVTLVDRIGGASLAVAVQGNYAFVGQSAEFSVLDIRDRSQPRRIAYLPLAANDITLQKDFAFVTNQQGVAIIAIGDPAKPLQVGRFSTPATLNALAVVGERLYASDPRTGLYIVNVAQPQKPFLIGFVPILQIADIAVQGELVYLATTAGLQIVSVGDPIHPSPRTLNAEVSNAEAVTVVDHYAYLTTSEGRLVVIDVADLDQTIVVSDLHIPTFTKNLQIIGNLAYVANGNQGVAVVDIQNRRQPRLLAVHKIGTLVTNLAVVGNSLFASDVSEGGVHLMDITHPEQLVEIGTFRTPGIALSVAVAGNYVYLATGLEGDITIVDHTNAAGLVSKSFYRTPNQTTKLTVSEDRLYAYGTDRSLEIFERSDPAHLVDLGTIQLNRTAQSIVSQASQTIVGDGNGLYILDAAQTDVPKQTDALSRLGKVEDMAVVGDSLLVATSEKGVLHIVLSEIFANAKIHSIPTQGYVHSVAATTNHGYLLTSRGKLLILNLRNPDKMEIVGQLQLSAKAQMIVVQDEIAYIAAGEAGVYMVDVAQPDAPKLMAIYDTPGIALNVAVGAGKIFVTDGYAGLLVLSLAD